MIHSVVMKSRKKVAHSVCQFKIKITRYKNQQGKNRIFFIERVDLWVV